MICNCPGAGQAIAFCIVPAGGVGIPGICYIVKNGTDIKHNKTAGDGKVAMVLPTGCPRSVGLLARLCQMKSQFPLFSGAGGHAYK